MINNIQAALDTTLKNWADSQSIVVAWENKKRPQSDLEPYLSSAIIPAETISTGLSNDSCNNYSGIYQISVNVRSGRGTVDSRPIIDGLLSLFSKGEEVTINGQKIRIEMSWRSGAIDNEAWYFIPVSVRYRSFV